MTISPSRHYNAVCRDIFDYEYVTYRPININQPPLEKQILFETIMDACVGCDNSLRELAYSTIEHDPSIGDLIPCFAKVINIGIRVNVNNSCLPMLIYLNRTIRAIVTNKHLDLTLYLHKFIPILMTCCVCRDLVRCASQELGHYTLRDFASKTLIMLVRNYESRITTLRSRVLKKMMQAFNTDIGNCIYGAIPIVAAFATDEELIELMPKYDALLAKYGQSSNCVGEILNHARIGCALLKHLHPRIHALRSPTNGNTAQFYQKH